MKLFTQFQKFLMIFHIYNNFVTLHGLNSNIFINNSLYDTYQNSAIDCIVSASYKHIPCGTMFTLVYSSYFIDDVNKLLSNKNCYTFLSRSFEIRKWRTWTDVYMFFTKNYHEMYTSFTTLSKDVVWNPRAYFFIIINDLHEGDFLEVFNILMNLNIFNVLLITKSEKGIFSAYIYHALEEGNCGRSLNKIEKINDCRNSYSVKINYTHLDHKFRNCVISVAATEDMPNVIFESKEVNKRPRKAEKGIEQYILDNIAEQENLTLQYIYTDSKHDYGFILSNSTITGLLGYLHNNTASIVIGGLMLMRNRISLFEYIWGYDTASLCLYAPALSEENWKKVYQEFGVGTWLLICFSYLFATVVITMSRRLLMGHEDKRRVILKIWGYLYGQTDNELIKLKKMKKIVIFWIWFTFFMTSFYNSALYSLLSRNVEVNSKIDTKSLSTLPWEPCISNAMRTFYKFTFNETLPRNTKANCKLTDDALDTVANNNKYYAMEMDYSYHMREPYYLDENGNPKLKGWQFTSDLMLAMYTTRGFPLQHKFQRYATFHLESGLLQRQRAAIYHQYVTPNNHHKKTFKIFHLSDFRIHYAILIIGYTISFVCFIIEINGSYVRK
uniref:Ionotropic receptor 60a2d n=1 Tax=Heliconius melpomene rosina TaxID=171916 RepID=A0A140G9G4_HELME|nr:ionotropic receptor 60a2d [Heliconius melpomene rosina]